jgi:DNA-binding XRE family transcriptional regulator
MAKKKVLSGQDLKAARLKAGVTQEWLADIVGDERPRISHIEASETLSKCWALIAKLLRTHGKEPFDKAK